MVITNLNDQFKITSVPIEDVLPNPKMMKYSYDAEETNFDELVVARSHEAPVLLHIGTVWKDK